MSFVAHGPLAFKYRLSYSCIRISKLGEKGIVLVRTNYTSREIKKNILHRAAFPCFEVYG